MKIKVFVVEDRDVDQVGLAGIINATPERDLKLVGMARENTPDLPALVKKSGADVVVVDLVLATFHDPNLILKNKETSGIQAIIALKGDRHLRDRIKTLAITGYSQFVKLAVEAGADD